MDCFTVIYLIMTSVLLLECVTQAQRNVPGFFSVPVTRFNRGGKINFQGLSLGQVCHQILMSGGKEALSDGMGAASRWFSTQKMNALSAGGTDPQMQCLFAQATGATTPGTVGNKDPTNIFGDYFDTIIEYPMVLDPCSSPQCDGKVNPTVLLMRKFGAMARGRMGGANMMGQPMNNLMGGAMNLNGLMGAFGGNSMYPRQQQSSPFNSIQGLASLMGRQNPMAQLMNGNAASLLGMANTLQNQQRMTNPFTAIPQLPQLSQPRQIQQQQQRIRSVSNTPSTNAARNNNVLNNMLISNMINNAQHNNRGNTFGTPNGHVHQTGLSQQQRLPKPMLPPASPNSGIPTPMDSVVSTILRDPNMMKMFQQFLMTNMITQGTNNNNIPINSPSNGVSPQHVPKPTITLEAPNTINMPPTRDTGVLPDTGKAVTDVVLSQAQGSVKTPSSSFVSSSSQQQQQQQQQTENNVGLSGTVGNKRDTLIRS